MVKRYVKLAGLCAGAALLGSIIYNAPKSSYEINGNEVKIGDLRDNRIVQYKNCGDIEYLGRPLNHNRLKNVIIDGRKYNSHNTQIYHAAEANYRCLRNQILSAKRQEKKERIAERRRERQRRIDERKQQEKEDLEILVRDPCQKR